MAHVLLILTSECDNGAATGQGQLCSCWRWSVRWQSPTFVHIVASIIPRLSERTMNESNIHTIELFIGRSVRPEEGRNMCEIF